MLISSQERLPKAEQAEQADGLAHWFETMAWKFIKYHFHPCCWSRVCISSVLSLDTLTFGTVPYTNGMVWYWNISWS